MFSLGDILDGKLMHDGKYSENEITLHLYLNYFSKSTEVLTVKYGYIYIYNVPVFHV